MAKPFVDISMIGDKALVKKMARLVDKVQTKIVRSALSKSATRLKKSIVRRVPVDTGRLKAAMSAAKTFTPKGALSRGVIVRAYKLPERSALGIDAGSPWYYPAHVEYGHRLKGGGHVPPKAFIRGTVNDNTDTEIAQIGRDIGKGIVREAAKK